MARSDDVAARPPSGAASAPDEGVPTPLTPGELALYGRIVRHVAAHRSAHATRGTRYPVPPPAEELDLPPGDPELGRLREFGLVEVDDDAPGGFVLRDPEPVEQQLLARMHGTAGGLQEAAAAALVRLREWPAALREVKAVYAPSRLGGPGREGFEVITGYPEINEYLDKLLDGATSEVICAQPGRRSRRDLTFGQERDRAAVARGVRYRTLYQPEALADEHVLAHLAGLAADHYRTRVLEAPFRRFIVVDRTHAMIPVLDPHPTRTEPDYEHALVTSVPAMVGWIVDGFERDWRAATDVRALSPSGDRDSAARLRRSRILHLLREGESHEAIARRLDLSVRTVRNHIQDDRDALGARSLYQHGYRAAERDRAVGGGSGCGCGPDGP